MDTFENVKNAIAEELNIDTNDIYMNSSLLSLKIDSLDLVDVILNLEDKFKIFIPDEEIEEFETVEDIVKHIENLI